MQRQDRATTNRDWRECPPHSCQAVHPKAARHARLEIFLTGLRKWPQKQQSDPFRDFAITTQVDVSPNNLTQNWRGSKWSHELLRDASHPKGESSPPVLCQPQIITCYIQQMIRRKSRILCDKELKISKLSVAFIQRAGVFCFVFESSSLYKLIIYRRPKKLLQLSTCRKAKKQEVTQQALDTRVSTSRTPSISAAANLSSSF